MPFSQDEIDRYQRQVILPEWGAAGQERVRAASVVVAGSGPAAEMAARYLAGAGVGRLSVSSPALGAALSDVNPHVACGLTALGLPRGIAAMSGAGGGPWIHAFDDTHAVGAALAVETLKLLLGLAHRDAIDLPALFPPDEPDR